MAARRFTASAFSPRILAALTDASSDQDALMLSQAWLAQGLPLEQDEVRDATELAMLRGWWNTSLALVTASARAQVDVSAAVHSTGIAPAFEWAQSSTSLYLSVKWSHKLDAPGTLGCVCGGVHFARRAVSLRAECRDKRKAFELALPLLHDVSPDNCTWSASSVGRATITLRKATAGVWSRLLESTKRTPNMHVWWDMKEKYEKEVEEYEKRVREEAKRAKEDAAAPADAASPAPDAPPAEPADAASPAPGAPTRSAIADVDALLADAVGAGAGAASVGASGDAHVEA